MNIPLKLLPAFKDYIWGGTRLKTDFGKHCSYDKVAESWELACHKDGNSIIDNGPYKGRTLSEYIKEQDFNVLGSRCSEFEMFPVLIKLIDAKDNLSVQVHPDNEYALKNEGEYGKTEMWYIVDCEKDSSLIYGFKNEISLDEFRNRINEGTLLEVTNTVPVKKGDVFFIRSGTLHAIGKGILIAEIQQNSNTTYRVFDYNRRDKNGNSRELHIKKACEVTQLKPALNYPASETFFYNGYSSKLLSSCEYFSADLLDISSEAEFISGSDTFVHLLVTEGNAVLYSKSGENIIMERGDSVFIPAECGKIMIKGKSQIIKTYIK